MLTGVSCAAVVDYRAAIIALLIFAVIVIATRYVSLGSHTGHGQAMPVTLLANGFSGLCLILTCASVAIIVAKHAGNIDRMIKHKEPKITFRKDISHKLDNDSF